MKQSIRKFSSLPKQLFEISDFYLVLFSPMLFIVSLLWFFIILPLAIWEQIIMKIWRKIFGRGKMPIKLDFTNQSHIFHSTIASDFSLKESRELDLVVYGATGFTGELICKYLRDNYSSSSSSSSYQLKWGIGGRSKNKLEELRDKLQLEVEVIVAECDNKEQLNEMCNKTRVVLSTVGPYALYGTSLVNTCAAYGTDYVDITGELDWVQYCTHQFSALAIQTNARIVNSCGHDSIPYDLIAYMLADKLKTVNREDLQSLQIFVEAKGGFSGGTLASMLAMLERQKYELAKVSLEKYNTLPGNEKPYDVKSEFQGHYFINYCSSYKQFVMFSVMASINFSVIQRSNSMLGYSVQSPKSTLFYRESMVPGGLMMNLYTYSLLVFTFTLLLLTPARYLLTKFLLPKPGQGPSEKILNEGFMNIIGRALGNKGTYANCSFNIRNEDPGYKGTGRMLAESALCFILNKSQITAKGGFHTPASAFGKVLMNRLQQTGTNFSYFSTNSYNVVNNKKD